MTLLYMPTFMTIIHYYTRGIHEYVHYTFADDRQLTSLSLAKIVYAPDTSYMHCNELIH